MDNTTKARYKRLGTWVEPTRPNKRTKVSTLDLLTGTAYEDPRRNIPCPLEGCPFKFTREYDKVVHLQSYHGQSAEDQQWVPTTGEDDFPEFVKLTDTQPVPQNTIRNPNGNGSVEDQLESQARAGGQFWYSRALVEGPVDDFHFGPESTDVETQESSQPGHEMFGPEEEDSTPMDPALFSQ